MTYAELRAAYDAANARKDREGREDCIRLWAAMAAAPDCPKFKTSCHYGSRAGQRQAKQRNEERREAQRRAADRRWK